MIASVGCARRIVCLTEEPVEILCELGCEDRIVGVSAYAVRPPGIAERKPVVTAFTGGSVEKIRELSPDLCIGFSDVQADLARDLIRAGLAVLVFNQRSLSEIFSVVLAIGRLVGRPEAARSLVDGYQARIEGLGSRTRRVRPRVYFEEWDDPLLCGSRWVSELVEVAGGRDIFAERAKGAKAAERRVQWNEVVVANPDVVFASWCGKPFDRASFLAREGASGLEAVRADRVFEVDPAIILQPGPAAITDGLDELARRLRS